MGSEAKGPDSSALSEAPNDLPTNDVAHKPRCHEDVSTSHIGTEKYEHDVCAGSPNILPLCEDHKNTK